MSTERMDALLEEAVLTRRVPDRASPDERAELERMLMAMGIVQAARSSLDDEARTTMPAARARFQQFITANTPVPATPPAIGAVQRRPGFFGRFFAGSPARALAGVAAAIGVLVLAAVLLGQFAFSGTESAYAQVVQPGDYVQVEGIVGEAAEGRLGLESELGPFNVQVSDDTSLVRDESPVELSALRPGDRVLVSGIAEPNRDLRAQTVIVGEPHPGPPPRVVAFRRLHQLRQALDGEVLTFTVSSDGQRGSLLIDAADGQRYLVAVEGRTVEDLLSRGASAIGDTVTISSAPGESQITVTVPANPGGETAPRGRGRSSLVSVIGVVTHIEQRPALAERAAVTVATVRTSEGAKTVLIRPQTRIFPARSGLETGAGLPEAAVGRFVSVSGGMEKRTGEVIADVVVLGQAAER